MTEMVERVALSEIRDLWWLYRNAQGGMKDIFWDDLLYAVEQAVILHATHWMKQYRVDPPSS